MVRHQVDIEVLMAVNIPFNVEVADLHNALRLEEVGKITRCWEVFQVGRDEELVGFVKILNSLRIAENVSQSVSY
jgi:hypothetical protein